MRGRLHDSALVQRLVRHRRQALTLGLLAGLSLVLIVYAYFDRFNPFRSDLALRLGTNLIIVIATYVIFNPLIEQVRIVATHEHPKLDYDAFIEHVAQSRQIVCILTTWTRLLEDPYRAGFLSALRQALLRGVVVRILLLDPASTAAELRGQELQGREDVPRLIMANLHSLEQFVAGDLNDRLRQQLQVRLYSASPSVLFYRWDGRAYLSLLPMARLAEDVPKLETVVTSVWADFVSNRFEALWTDPSTRTLSRYLQLPIAVTDETGNLTEFEVNYVVFESIYYVENSSLTHFVARHGIETVAAHIIEPRHASHGDAVVYSLSMLDDWPGVEPSVVEAFRCKYEHRELPLVFCLSRAAGSLPAQGGRVL